MQGILFFIALATKHMNWKFMRDFSVFFTPYNRSMNVVAAARMSFLLLLGFSKTATTLSIFSSNKSINVQPFPFRYRVEVVSQPLMACANSITFFN